MTLFALSDEKLEVIFRAVRLGMPMTRAAILSNVSSNAFKRYRDRGAALVMALDTETIAVKDLDTEDTLCLKLVLGMDKAKSEGVQGWLEVVNDAGSGADPDWRSAAWLFDRRAEGFQKHTFEEKTVVGVEAQVSLEQVLEMKRQLRDWEAEEFEDVATQD